MEFGQLGGTMCTSSVTLQRMEQLFLETRPLKRQNAQGTNYTIPIPRPAVIAKYQGEMGYVDTHNQFRQGILHMPNIWKTKRSQTRIQLEIVALTLVDTFLACRKLMPRWQDEGDEESIFWKFVHVLLPQIDSRGNDDFFHEPEHAEIR
jgi:hypothetical protein